jgi:uncharacterized protein
MPKGPRAVSSAWLLALVCFLLFVVGCGGLSARTVAMRTALDHGQPVEAIAALDRELGVKDGALPTKLRRDDALLVLDRATIHQSVAAFDKSKRDYEAADKALDVLDLSHGTGDDVGRWLYSDSAGRYVAPPHEKLLVNVLNLVNYLETRDLSGARVEARRLLVTSRYLRDFEDHKDASLGVGSFFAGLAFEKSGEADEAARFYREAREIVPQLDEAKPFAGDVEEEGEIIVIVGDGRVPHRIAEHLPIGLALTRSSMALSGGDRQEASALAAQGLVTWVNFPTLAPSRPLPDRPKVYVDLRAYEVVEVLDVDALVRSHWRKIEGDVMAAAITRAVARVVAGKAIEAAANTSKDKGVRAVGLLTSLILQASLSAADVPDTRSWETLPARISIARIRVPAGQHDIEVSARGTVRTGRVAVAAGGWTTLSTFGLR